MCCFAGIATWRFGPYLKEFSSFEKTMQTQFIMMLGSIDYFNWGENSEMPRALTELKFFVILFIVVVFFLILNFVLAIIVEAYIKVRQQCEEMETQGEFLNDLKASISAACLRFYHGWPSPRMLGVLLSEWDAKNSVGYLELDNTGLFSHTSSYKSIRSFLEFYSRFDFLEPRAIGKYGKSAHDDSEWSQRGQFSDPDSALILKCIHRSLAPAIKKENFTLKQLVGASIRTVAARRQRQGKVDDAAELLGLNNTILKRIQARKEPTSERYSIPSAEDIRRSELREKEEIEQNLLLQGVQSECVRGRTKLTPVEWTDGSTLKNHSSGATLPSSFNDSASDCTNIQMLLELIMAERRQMSEAIAELKAAVSSITQKATDDSKASAVAAADATSVAAADNTPAGSLRKVNLRRLPAGVLSAEARARAHLPGSTMIQEDKIDHLFGICAPSQPPP